MTEMDQIQQDLSFVRSVIGRRSRIDESAARVYLVWAVYVLVGYSLLDVNVTYANWFFAVGGIIGGIISGIMGKRAALARGESDRDEGRRVKLHFFGGILLAVVASAALQVIVPGLRGFHGGQIIVVMIGLVYFLAGVHLDGYFLWLGPLVMIAGLAMGFIPHLPGTCTGALIAVGLTIPYLARRNRGQAR